MKKFLVVLVALIGLTIVDAGAAQAAGGWRRRSRVTYVPAPSVTVAQGQSGTGYRTYSYQPSTAPVIQSYQRSTKAAPYQNAGRHSAGFKLTDF